MDRLRLKKSGCSSRGRKWLREADKNFKENKKNYEIRELRMQTKESQIAR
jgi:hypothetical protein